MPRSTKNVLILFLLSAHIGIGCRYCHKKFRWDGKRRMCYKGTEGFSGKHRVAGGVFGAGSGIYGTEHENYKIKVNWLSPVCPKVPFLKSAFRQVCDCRLGNYYEDKCCMHRLNLDKECSSSFYICWEININM